MHERKVNWALVRGNDAAGQRGVAIHTLWDARVGAESPRGRRTAQKEAPELVAHLLESDIYLRFLFSLQSPEN